jgi:hypothetical protein
MPMFYTPKTGEHLAYYADAEVDVQFLAVPPPKEAYCGSIFEFHFQKIGLSKIGHLDDRQPIRGRGWPRQKGNAYLCLYLLTLSQTNQAPGGQPFDEGNNFEVFSTDNIVARGTVTRLTSWNQRVLLCRPIDDLAARVFAARAENVHWSKVRHVGG